MKITGVVVISKALREKVLAKDYKMSDRERVELDAVYFMITSKFGKGRKVPKCPSNSCLEMPYKILFNWMTYYEPELPKKTNRKTTVKTIGNEDPLDKFSLAKLRTLYPEVSSRSKASFIEKVNQLKTK